MKNVIVLNAAGGLFLLYLMIFMIRMFRIRKKCSPVHKHPVRVEQYPKSPKHLIAILSIVILWGLWVYGIFYYEMVQLPLLYLSAKLFSIVSTGKNRSAWYRDRRYVHSMARCRTRGNHPSKPIRFPLSGSYVVRIY